MRTTPQPNANAVFANNYLPVLYSNIGNRAVLGLSQVGSCTDICKNLSDKIKVKPIKRFLFSLGCSILPSTKHLFPRRTLFQFLCPHRPTKLGRQLCWVAYLLVCVPGPVGDDGSFLSYLLVFLLSPSQGRDRRLGLEPILTTAERRGPTITRNSSLFKYRRRILPLFLNFISVSMSVNGSLF